MNLRVLNLGAGVQSTTIYLMMIKGLIQKADFAIFADTQDEPEAVYRHLEWLKQQNGPPILVRTRGKLSSDIKRGENATGNKFISIPFYESQGGLTSTAMLKRQCSREYKIAVIDKTIRRELLGLKRGGRIPKDTLVTQVFGISLDESGRASRLYERIVVDGIKWLAMEFPLIDRFMTRQLCKQWLDEHGNVPHKVPRSSCVYCPYRSDEEWLNIRESESDWNLAVEVDEALRKDGRTRFLHKSCQPLVQIEFKPAPKEVQTGFRFHECMGVCGV